MFRGRSNCSRNSTRANSGTDPGKPKESCVLKSCESQHRRPLLNNTFRHNTATIAPDQRGSFGTCIISVSELEEVQRQGEVEQNAEGEESSGNGSSACGVVVDAEQELPVCVSTSAAIASGWAERPSTAAVGSKKPSMHAKPACPRRRLQRPVRRDRYDQRLCRSTQQMAK